MRIISASRRTDIPAFYSEWFMNRIRAGFCHWSNPFSGQVYRISLRPEDVRAIVFWTRNPAPLIPRLPELTNTYKISFHYTLIGYGRPLESHNPAVETALDTFCALSDVLSPDFVMWRYDPIVISCITPPGYHLERFAYLAERLAGATRRCTYSFIDFYNKTKRNLNRLDGITFEELAPPERVDLLARMAEIAARHGIELVSCCEDVPGIRRGGCIDLDLIRRVTGEADLTIPDRPTRPHCGCIESVDIGSYDTCLFGCAYCYATKDRAAALQRHAEHDPQDSILIRPPQLRGVDLEGLGAEKTSTQMRLPE
jgi:hypothetical protein